MFKCGGTSLMMGLPATPLGDPAVGESTYTPTEGVDECKILCAWASSATYPDDVSAFLTQANDCDGFEWDGGQCTWFKGSVADLQSGTAEPAKTCYVYPEVVHHGAEYDQYVGQECAGPALSSLYGAPGVSVSPTYAAADAGGLNRCEVLCYANR